MDKKSSIAIIDSGVGGLTVAKEILINMPNENIIYLGDSKNCPYGNKSADEIFALTKNMIDYLVTLDIKCVVIACNTISTMINRIRPLYDFPIISIVEAACDEVTKNELSSVGLIATAFTVNSGKYQETVKAASPDCKVVGVPSKKLAEFVDNGILDTDEVKGEIRCCIDKILSEIPTENVILGCTHYPILEKAFKECYGSINFINPAKSQCDATHNILKNGNLLNESGGYFKLYTTGCLDNYYNILKLLGAKLPNDAEQISI